jgi:tetratricopeptide (TPR) repeat protein
MKTPCFLINPARRLILPVIACLACLGGLVAAAEPTPLARLEAEMRAGRYEAALALADAAVAAGPDADRARFHLANALMLVKRPGEAVAACDRLLEQFPDSPWRAKAVFLKAQALIEQKQFAAAAGLYEAESARLLATGRKQELAGEILRFAEKLEAKPDPNRPDDPPPDFAKAHSLYTKALTLELSRDFRDGIFFRKARALQQAGQFAQAVQDFQAYLAEYDPLWTGPAGSGAARLPMQNPPPAGRRVGMARFHLAEALHQAGNPEAARLELEDLLKRIAAPGPAGGPWRWNLPAPRARAWRRKSAGCKCAPTSPCARKW